MKTIEISDTFFLDDAISLYRYFWDRNWRGHKEKQICHFDGGMTDLYMLDYCEYELGHPDENYEAASIIWANVMIKHTNLRWGEKKAEVYLFSEFEHSLRFEINVHKFVKDTIDSGISQFDSFSILTEKLLIKMLLSSYSIDELPRLKSIVHKYIDQGSDCYSEQLIRAIGEIYQDHEKNINTLHNTLGGKNIAM